MSNTAHPRRAATGRDSSGSELSREGDARDSRGNDILLELAKHLARQTAREEFATARARTPVEEANSED
jgi:hypothetical protein